MNITGSQLTLEYDPEKAEAFMLIAEAGPTPGAFCHGHGFGADCPAIAWLALLLDRITAGCVWLVSLPHDRQGQNQ